MSSCFSSDYQEAREKFFVACEAAGADLDCFQHPSLGPDGRALYTDVALLGPEESDAVLILQSGTHGVEGFAGSAIQAALLGDALLSQLVSKLRLVLIHAINPWGFAHLRRVNEDNVDLNRNFIDHAQRHPTNLEYERLAHILAPTALRRFSRIASVLRLLSFGAVYGRETVQSAVSRGQYCHAKGLFFGGHFDVWSNRTFRQVLNRYVSGSNRVAFVDIHTGLGPSGYGELVSIDPIGSPAHQRALKWWGDRVKTTKAKESVSADVVGTSMLALADTLQGSEVTAASLEFGTVPTHAVLWALIAENWAHHHAERSDSRIPAIKEQLRRAFYTDTDEWKSAVWSQGKEIIARAFTGLTHAEID